MLIIEYRDNNLVVEFTLDEQFLALLAQPKTTRDEILETLLIEMLPSVIAKFFNNVQSDNVGGLSMKVLYKVDAARFVVVQDDINWDTLLTE